MSAWDVAGAVVTGLAGAFFWWLVLWVVFSKEELQEEDVIGGFLICVFLAIAATGGFAFNVARLFGAHA